MDITKVLQLDSQVINYGQFVAGKVLGSTLQITNIGTKALVLEVAVDQHSTHYDSEEIFGPYNKEELPFDYAKEESKIENSENSLSCWFIENPICKEL